MEKISVTQHRLLTRISLEDADIIRQTLADVSSLDSLSANNMLSILNNTNISSPLFQGINLFLSLLEKPEKRTYRDSNGHMTIGIGLNLDNSDTEALIVALNDKFNLKLDYNDLKKTEGLPPKGLTDEEVSYLLWLTLVGTTQKTPDHGIVTFKGETPALIHQLNHHIPGLADVPFKPYQLITLQSMAFNRPDLIGPGICQALAVLAATGDEKHVIIEIMEHSNKELDIGLANRRLNEAALFHYFVDDMRLNWREANRLLSKNSNVEFVGGWPISGLPYGNEEQTFLGYKEITIDPGLDPKQLDSIYYGSYGSDLIENLDDGSKVVFGGSGADTMSLAPSLSPGSFHYLAGNAGRDSYILSTQSGHTLLYDATQDGQLFLSQNPGVRTHLVGAAISLIVPEQFIMYSSNHSYTLIRQPEEANLLKIHWPDLDKSNVLDDPDNSITIPNFTGGQFNLVLVNQAQHMFSWPSGQQQQSIVLPNGNAVALIGSSASNQELLTAYVCNRLGETLNQFVVASAPLNYGSNPFYGISISPLASGNFAVSWSFLKNTSEYGDIFSTVEGVICTPTGELSPFYTALPSGPCIAKTNQSPSCFLNSVYAIGLFDDQFITTFTGQFTAQDNTGYGALFCQLSTQSYSQTVTLLPAAGYWLRSAKLLRDGNIIVTLDPPNSTLYSMICIFTPTGQLITQLEYGCSDIDIAPLDNGFLAAYTCGINGLQYPCSRVYSYQAGWSKELILDPMGYVGLALRSVTSLPNNNALFAWYGFAVIEKKRVYFLKGSLIDSNNELIGDVFQIDTGGQLSVPALSGCYTLPNGDCIILANTPYNSKNKTDAILKSYFIESSAMQPAYSSRIASKNDHRFPASGKTLHKIMINEQSNQPEQTSSASCKQPSWYSPSNLILSVGGMPSKMLNYLWGSESKTEKQTETGYSAMSSAQSTQESVHQEPASTRSPISILDYLQPMAKLFSPKTALSEHARNINSRPPVNPTTEEHLVNHVNQEVPLTDQLQLIRYGLHYLGKLLPRNWQQPLGDEKKSILNRCSDKILHLEQKLTERKEARVGKSGLFQDQFAFIEQELFSTKNSIQQILKENKISTNQLLAIQHRVERIDEVLADWVAKKQILKRTKVDTKIARLERRAKRTGITVGVKTIENPVNNTITLEKITDPEILNQKCIDQIWARDNEESSFAYSNKTTFWHHNSHTATASQLADDDQEKIPYQP